MTAKKDVEKKEIKKDVKVAGSKGKLVKKKDAKLPEYIFDVIRNPLVTEKSQFAIEQNKYTFLISTWATKRDVKQTIESLFGVNVTKVNVINSKGKIKRFRGVTGKRNDTRKAIVTLAEGETIDIASKI